MKVSNVEIVDKELYIKNKVEQMVIEILDSNFLKDEGVFERKMSAIKLAMQHIRDREIMKRISQGQQIRIFNVITDNPEQFKEYVDASMPQMIPKIQIENS